MLRRLGVRVADADDGGVLGEGSVWRWDTGRLGVALLDYVDLVYVGALRLLTEDGRVAHSRTALALLPALSSLAALLGGGESRSQLALERVAAHWHARLELHAGSAHTAQLDALMRTLDGLVDEHRALLNTPQRDQNAEQEQEQEEGGQALPASVAAVVATVARRRQERLAELTTLIKQVQDELHALTAHLDHLATTTAKSSPLSTGTSAAVQGEERKVEQEEQEDEEDAMAVDEEAVDALSVSLAALS